MPKVAKHKIASISLTVRDRAISSKFSTPRVSKESTTPTFEKLFQKWRPFRIFEFFERVRKLHEIAFICRNFKLPGYLMNILHPLLKKISKMAAILNFCRKSAKTQNCFYQNTLHPLLKKFSKMAAIFNFRRKSAKTQKCLYLLNRWR